MSISKKKVWHDFSISPSRASHLLTPHNYLNQFSPSSKMTPLWCHWDSMSIALLRFGRNGYRWPILLKNMRAMVTFLVSVLSCCHQWSQTCSLYGPKPLSKPMLGYCQLGLKEKTSLKFLSKYKIFHSWKCIWKYCLRNGGHVIQGEMS